MMKVLQDKKKLLKVAEVTLFRFEKDTKQFKQKKKLLQSIPEICHPYIPDDWCTTTKKVDMEYIWYIFLTKDKEGALKMYQRKKKARVERDPVNIHPDWLLELLDGGK